MTPRTEVGRHLLAVIESDLDELHGGTAAQRAEAKTTFRRAVIAIETAGATEATELLRRAFLVVRLVDDYDAEFGDIFDVDVRELRQAIERYLERLDSERDR